MSLKQYWIQSLQELEEFKGLADTEDAELDLIRTGLEQILDDQFIQTATEAGIAKRESMLAIQPFADETLEDRRFRLTQRFQNQLPYTHRQLANRLALITGPDGYTLTFDYGAYSLVVTVNLGNKRQFAEVERISQKLVPANILLTVTLGYNRYVDLASYTYQQLAAYTYQQLREEIL